MTETMASPGEERKGPFSAGDTVEGRYRVHSVIGAGGMGVVYAAEHLFTGATVALKALYKPEKDFRERMRLEARALADIRHPNVVPVTDGGVTEEGVVWFAMPRLEGHTLRDAIHADGGMSVERALRFGIQIALGLAAAHDTGLVHRDLKPENVFVLDEDDSIRVLDFGTSKFQRGQLKTTDRFRVIGTHAYMSPERLQADQVDHRADIYALGHILYEMLTGMHALSEGPGPLDLPPIHELGMRQIYGAVPPLSERAPHVPDVVSAIVYRALAKSRNARHGSMRELATDLGSALEALRTTSTQPPDAQPRDAHAVDRSAPTHRLGEQASASAHATIGKRLPADKHCATGSPELVTERTVPAHQTGATHAGSVTDPKSAAQQTIELEMDLVTGGAMFAAADDSPELRALTHFCATSRGTPEIAALLRATLWDLSALLEPQRPVWRDLLIQWHQAGDAERHDVELKLDQIARASGRHRTALGKMDRLAALAVGACAFLPPQKRLPAAEEALAALDNCDPEVQAFALGALVALGRAKSDELTRARGALIALLRGGEDDTELARAELSRVMLDVAARADEERAPPDHPEPPPHSSASPSPDHAPAPDHAAAHFATLESAVHPQAVPEHAAPAVAAPAVAVAAAPVVPLTAPAHGPRGTLRITTLSAESLPTEEPPSGAERSNPWRGRTHERSQGLERPAAAHAVVTRTADVTRTPNGSATPNSMATPVGPTKPEPPRRGVNLSIVVTLAVLCFALVFGVMRLLGAPAAEANDAAHAAMSAQQPATDSNEPTQVAPHALPPSAAGESTSHGQLASDASAGAPTRAPSGATTASGTPMQPPSIGAGPVGTPPAAAQPRNSSASAPSTVAKPAPQQGPRSAGPLFGDDDPAPKPTAPAPVKPAQKPGKQPGGLPGSGL